MSRQYLVLRSEPGHLDFVDTLNDAFDDIAAATGYRFRYAFSKQAGEGLMRLGYMEEKKRAAISLIDDHQSRLSYLMVEAESDRTASDVSSWLRERLPTIPLSELQDVARRDLATDPQSLVRLAVGSGERPDETSAALIRQGLEHADAKTRKAAVEAASLTRWPEFLPELERKLREDADPAVRETAARALGKSG